MAKGRPNARSNHSQRWRASTRGQPGGATLGSRRAPVKHGMFRESARMKTHEEAMRFAGRKGQALLFFSVVVSEVARRGAADCPEEKQQLGGRPTNIIRSTLLGAGPASIQGLPWAQNTYFAAFMSFMLHCRHLPFHANRF